MGNSPPGKFHSDNSDMECSHDNSVIMSATARPPRKKFLMDDGTVDESYFIKEVTSKLKSTQLNCESEKMSICTSSASGAADVHKTLPTVFKWTSGGENVLLCGSFTGWQYKIPMVKSSENFYTIIELPEGRHEFQFIVDNECKVDKQQPVLRKGNQLHNFVWVRPSDFSVEEALNYDMACSKTPQNPYLSSTTCHLPPPSSTTTTSSHAHAHSHHLPPPPPPPTRHNRRRTISVDSGYEESERMAFELGRCSSPPGHYSQEEPVCIKSMRIRAQSGGHTSATNSIGPSPPLLPPHLLQAVLNQENPQVCRWDPHCLPNPNHVVVNHLYALSSIQDGVMVLSTVTRYRRKFVTTVSYKPV